MDFNYVNSVKSNTENVINERLYNAALRGDIKVLEEMLKTEPIKRLINQEVNPYNCTLLRFAVKGGNVDAVKILLLYGAEVDKPDMKNQTPLFVAINESNYDCAKVLLAASANPDGNEGNISSPLYIAVQKKREKEVMLLLRYGANTEPYRRNFYNYSGGSYPLQAAVVYSSLPCYKILLAGGAEPDPRKLKFRVPNVVVAQLSLIHTIASHHRLDIKDYAKLFVLFGGYLWQKNRKDELVTDLDMPILERMAIHELMGTPLTLRQLCRISIRREIGRKRLKFVKGLRLPQPLIDFLLYKDIIEEEFLLYR